MEDNPEMPGLPQRESCLSKMAEDIAVQRFAESNLPEAERICYDPYAVHFIDPGLLKWAEEHPAEVKAMAEAWERKVPGWSTVIRTRVRFFDDAVLAAIKEGCRQLVLLGAGYDTRAYRLEGIRDTTVFEVDRRELLEAKTMIVRKLFGFLPGHVQYVPVELGTGDLWQDLAEAGYSAENKTLFLLEGLVMYLPRQDVEALLTSIRSHAGPDSIVRFDYVPDFIISGTSGRSDAAVIRHYTAKAGEPFLSGFGDGEAKALLEREGFVDVRVTAGEDLRPLYFCEKNAKRPISDLMLFVSAMVPE